MDSTRGVDLMSAALAGTGRPFPVLVELGLSGRRAGCRSTEEAQEVAEAVRGAPGLVLAGVEGFEGVVKPGSLEVTLGSVNAFLADLTRLAEDLHRTGAFAALDEVIVSAGGSAFFDRVVDVVRTALVPVLHDRLRLVLRSGCYVTHDSARYDGLSPLGSVRGPADPALRFRNALEVWGSVSSRPKPDLAILGIGRRDVAFDQGLPIPLLVKDGQLRDVAGSMEVLELNDQHAFVRTPPDDPLRVGDLVGCGISHPCTAFDKWSLIPVVDDSYTVVDAVRTFF